VLHHTGFTALVSLFLAFLFNFLEGRKPKLGFKVIGLVFLVLLLLEGLLIEYYVTNYEILGAGFVDTYSAKTSVGNFFIAVLSLLFVATSLFYLFYRITASVYKVISRMYPFTIVLFSLFLATLSSNKKPIIENKTQHLVYSVANELFDFNKYEGKKEFPLLKPYEKRNDLVDYFNLKEEKPNLVFIIIDGLGSDFVGDKAIYSGFTPFLDSVTSQSLYWSNHLSNTGESYAALPSLLGSLPFGKNGFTNAAQSVNRQTLYGILKKNGYATSFNYGGNSSLNQLDKFLFEERVDYILDKKGFGESYTMQDEDAAGISLGYPDKELFRKWHAGKTSFKDPRLDVFLTLSTKKPFLIPNAGIYEQRVKEILSASNMSERSLKLIRKNKEIFASLLYLDEALKSFFAAYKRNSEFQNTIFVITGSHNLIELPQIDNMGRYKVPLLIYSPLVRKPQTINALVSHADVVPSILGMLQDKYAIHLPKQVAWIGNGLVHEGVFDKNKEIPLYRYKRNIRDYIDGTHYLSGGSLYEMDENLRLMDPKGDVSSKGIRAHFRYFKAVNEYVMANDKIIPSDLSLFAQVKIEPTKQEMVWINSVFNGNDFDNAYQTAKELAFDGDRERALLLCGYILTQVPGHADTEILMGRIYAWQGNYETSIDILERAIQKYPVYSDGYAALLDAYFWSNKNEKALPLETKIKKNNIQNIEIAKKIERAFQKLEREAADNEAGHSVHSAKIDAQIASSFKNER